MKTFEKTLSQQTVFDGKIVHLRVDEAELPNGKVVNREVIEHPGGVCVAAFDENDCLYVVRQFRYPFGRELIEIPAGKLEKGEDPLTCGKRELLEEVGCTAESYESLGTILPTPAYVGEVIHLYLAKNLTHHEQQLDEDEFLNVERIPFDQAVEMVMDGTITDAKTQIAILKLWHLRNR